VRAALDGTERLAVRRGLRATFRASVGRADADTDPHADTDSPAHADAYATTDPNALGRAAVCRGRRGERSTRRLTRTARIVMARQNCC
jgi:hypothetical protein